MLVYFLSQIDFLAVVFASIAGMILGGVWYMPGVFGGAWQTSIGKEQWRRVKPLQTVVVRVAATVITAMGLAILLAGGGVTTFWGAIRLAAVVALGVVTPIIAADFHFTGRPARLIVMTCAHRVAHVFVISAVLGAFRQFG